MENVLHQCPHSLSDSCLRSKSLDRHGRFLSWCRLERHMTSCNPEVEPISSKGAYGKPQGYLTRAWVERGEESSWPVWWQERLHPQEMPTIHVGGENRMDITPEPSINNYEVWLTWWAHFLDTLHWLGELATIPDVDDLRRLTQKIRASFLILAVRCETPWKSRLYHVPCSQMSSQE